MLYGQNGVTGAKLRHDEYGHMKHGNLGDLVKFHLAGKSTGGRGGAG